MAFSDITRFMYDDQVRLDYKDSSHRYYARERINKDLPKEDDKAWGKPVYPKGVTTLLGDTLEKKGLMTWALGMAMRELFGFYDFTTDTGEKKIGFSKGVGTMWDKAKLALLDDNIEDSQKKLLPTIQSANKAWTRKQRQGGDIGSLVHNFIEQYIINDNQSQPIEIKDYLAIQSDDVVKDDEWLDQATKDVEMANKALTAFTNWWSGTDIKSIALEELVYSKEYNIAGTFDGIFKIGSKRVMGDYKTTNASKSAGAPSGIYYSYFIQLGLYVLAYYEANPDAPKFDDLMLVSCRKDGGFKVIYASDIGLTVEDCVNWGKSVITTYKLMDKTKRALIELGKE